MAGINLEKSPVKSKENTGETTTDSPVSGNKSIQEQIEQYETENDENCENVEFPISLSDEEQALPENMDSSPSPLVKRYSKRNKLLKSSSVVQDLFETQNEDIELILAFIEGYTDALILEPFCGNGAISNFLKAKGYKNVVEQDLITVKVKTNFMTENIPSNIEMIISNPPFNLKYEILLKSFMWGKPFIYLLPFETLCYKKCAELFQQYGIFVGIIQPCPKFIKDGETVKPVHCAWYFGNFPFNVSGRVEVIYLTK